MAPAVEPLGGVRLATFVRLTRRERASFSYRGFRPRELLQRSSTQPPREHRRMIHRARHWRTSNQPETGGGNDGKDECATLIRTPKGYRSTLGWHRCPVRNEEGGHA